MGWWWEAPVCAPAGGGKPAGPEDGQDGPNNMSTGTPARVMGGRFPKACFQRGNKVLLNRAHSQVFAHRLTFSPLMGFYFFCPVCGFPHIEEESQEHALIPGGALNQFGVSLLFRPDYKCNPCIPWQVFGQTFGEFE